MRAPRWNRLFPRIEKREAPLVGSLCALHFLVICAFTLARVARDGLLLSRLPVQSLPFIYLGLALWTAVASVVFGRLTLRTPTHRALSWALGGTAAALLCFGLLLRFNDDLAAIAVYLWVGAFGPLMVSEFWSLANERVNPRQARRLFGLIGGAGILGGLAGGAAASFAGRLVPPQGLLVAVAALHLAAVAVAKRSGMRAEEAAPVAERSERPQETGLAGALRRPYVRLLVALFLAGGLTSATLDYAFKYALQRHATDAGQITSIVGAFYGLQSLLALLAQVGLAGAVLRRFGARTASLVLPGGLFAGACMTLTWPAFPLVMATRLYDATLRVSMGRTAWEFLFYPLPDELRRSAKRFVDGVVGRVAEGAGGVLILGLNAVTSGSLAQLSILTAILSAAWFGAELAVNRHYIVEVSAALRRMLPGGRLQPAPPDLDPPLEHAFRSLASLYPEGDLLRAHQGIRSPNARLRAQSMEVLDVILRREHKVLILPLVDKAQAGSSPACPRGNWRTCAGEVTDGETQPCPGGGRRRDRDAGARHGEN